MKTIIRYLREDVVSVADQIKALGVDPEVVGKLTKGLPVRRGQPIRTLVAFVGETHTCFGISRCHVGLDSTSKQTGRETAAGRAWEVQRKMGIWETGGIQPKNTTYHGVGTCGCEDCGCGVGDDDMGSPNAIFIRKDGLAGFIENSHMDAMLVYFYNVEFNPHRKKHSKFDQNDVHLIGKIEPHICLK